MALGRRELFAGRHHAGPLHSYQILEGVVDRSAVRVSPEDLPSAHFTHDFIFKVVPDPPFRHLLSQPSKVPVENAPDRVFVQNTIEVEWESGLAQADNRTVNPASAASIRGESFGFYSGGPPATGHHLELAHD